MPVPLSPLQELDFVGYHLRRTTLMLFAHSLLPLVYLVGLEVVSSYSVVRGRGRGRGDD